MRPAGKLEIVGWFGAALLVACAIAYAATREAAPTVNIRWRNDVAQASQLALQQRYALAGCQRRTDGIDLCVLLDTSRRNLAAIVGDPSIEDTHHIDRGTLTISDEASRGPATTWIALRWELLRRPGAITLVLMAAGLLMVVGWGRRGARVAGPPLRAVASRLAGPAAVIRAGMTASAVRAGTGIAASVAAIRTEWTRMAPWCSNPTALLSVLAAALLVFQLSSILFELSRYATDAGRLRAFDEDAALAVEVMERTRWYNDNGFRFYGPLYYRIAHTFEAVSPLPDPVRSAHFYLLLTSLLCVYGVAAVLTLPLAMRWPMRLLSITVLTAAFMQQDVWREMLFRARNDWLLSLCAAGLAVALLLGRRHPDSRVFLVSAPLTIGLGLLTKFTFLLFLPSAVLLVVSNRLLRSRWKALAGITAASYFLVGAPQSFNLERDLGALRELSAYNRVADLATVQEWVTLGASQLTGPLAALILAWCLLSTRKPRPAPSTRRPWERLVEVAAIVLPFALLLTRKVLTGHDYYPLPFVAFLLGGIAVLASGVRLPWFTRPRFAVAAFVAVAGFVVWTRALVPGDLGAMLRSEADCRVEADDLYRFLEQRALQGETVLMDPYVPRPAERRFARYWKGTYTNNWEAFAAASPRWVVIQPRFAGVYLGEQPEYLAVWTSDPAASAAFYRALLQDAPVTSPDGRRLTRERTYACGWQVWRVEPADVPPV